MPPPVTLTTAVDFLSLVVVASVSFLALFFFFFFEGSSSSVREGSFNLRLRTASRSAGASSSTFLEMSGSQCGSDGADELAFVSRIQTHCSRFSWNSVSACILLRRS